jgi:hypothetical protein
VKQGARDIAMVVEAAAIPAKDPYA